MRAKYLLAAMTAAVLATAMLGAPANADVVVNAGTLDFDPAGAPTIGDFQAVTLNGTPQLTNLLVDPFTVVDASGTAAGWNVLLTVPDFVNGLSTIAASNVS